MGSSFSPNPECWKLRTFYSPCDSMKTQSVVYSLSVKHVTERNHKNNNNHKNKNNMVCRLVNGFGFSIPKYSGVQRVKHVCSVNFDEFFHSEEILEPSLLGIKPEAPSWPEREEILRLSFEMKVKSVGIPLSIRMIKKKLQLEQGFKDSATSSELMTQCSVKKTFSSMLFILHELQNHALQTKEAICCEDLKSVMAKLQREMDDSFVWLFQQVFWVTPNLMVDVMVFLVNFSVLSMSNNVSNSEADVDVDVDVGQGEFVKELTEEEEMIWNSMLEEVSKMETLDHETVRMFVAPLCVELEGDEYEEYEKTELYYKKHLRLTPYNSLLLSNYAQFLFLVMKDNDRAEEYYKHSVMVESPEAEAFSRYADFLWKVRNDTWAAELRYLQAIEIEPNNSHYSSKYASFLWNTGGQDSQDSTTGFPIEELDNLQI